jgi:hypothetical protein
MEGHDFIILEKLSQRAGEREGERERDGSGVGSLGQKKKD